MVTEYVSYITTRLPSCGPLKDEIHARHFVDDDELKQSLRQRPPTLQQRVLRNWHTSSRVKAGKGC